MTHDHPSRDHRDLRERTAVRFFRMVNPLTLRMIPAGIPTGAPNVLMLIPGRRSGIERTSPVTVLDFEGHTYVQATYRASGWAEICVRPRKRPWFTLAGAAVRYTRQRFQPTKQRQFSGARSRPATARVRYAGCSARASGRPSGSCAGTAYASTTHRRNTSPRLSATRYLSSKPSDGRNNPSSASED